MRQSIIISGQGGQGIMLLGKILAEAVMRENKQVTWLPAYGAEVRGGTAYCMVVVSDEEIASPFIDTPDTLIIMNEPSFVRFAPTIARNGLLLVNSSLVKKTSDCLAHPSGNMKKACSARVLSRAFTDTAIALGNPKVANIVALGCYIATTRIVTVDTVLEVIRESAPPDKQYLIEINEKALYAGMNLADKENGSHGQS